MLTANHKKAEQCFVAGIDECVNDNSVFREWAHSWTKCAIIRQAVRMVAPCGDLVANFTSTSGPEVSVRRRWEVESALLIIFASSSPMRPSSNGIDYGEGEGCEAWVDPG